MSKLTHLWQLLFIYSGAMSGYVFIASAIVGLLCGIIAIFLKYMHDPLPCIRRQRFFLSEDAYQDLISQYNDWASAHSLIDLMFIPQSELEASVDKYIQAAQSSSKVIWVPPVAKSDKALSRYRHHADSFQRKHFMCFYAHVPLLLSLPIATILLAFLAAVIALQLL